MLCVRLVSRPASFFFSFLFFIFLFNLLHHLSFTTVRPCTGFPAVVCMQLASECYVRDVMANKDGQRGTNGAARTRTVIEHREHLRYGTVRYDAVHLARPCFARRGGLFALDDDDDVVDSIMMMSMLSIR